MSEPPVVFKRTKTKPTQRARVSAAEDAVSVVENEADAEEAPSALAAKLKKKTRAKAKSTLSFGGEEEVRCQHAMFR